VAVKAANSVARGSISLPVICDKTGFGDSSLDGI